MKIMQRGLACIGLLFGFVTLVAGTRVLLGSDPGYVVFQPLLIFNVAMGFVYIIASIMGFQNAKRGMKMAGLIFSLNVIVLAIIFFLFEDGGIIAVDSLRAMSLRTTVWFILFLGFAWLNRKNGLNTLKFDR